MIFYINETITIAQFCKYKFEKCTDSLTLFKLTVYSLYVYNAVKCMALSCPYLSPVVFKIISLTRYQYASSV